jgi:hypothetical protein
MTLNNLISLLRKFSEDHGQINSFGCGEIAEIGAAKDITYPVMWVNMNPSRYSANQLRYSINIIFADLIYDDKSNELEVQSDQQSIALDALSYLNDNPDYDFQTDPDATITYFTDRFGDLAAGVVLQLVIRDPKPLDRCVIPI